MRRRLAKMIIKVSGWRVVGDVPRQGVLVGAPHTSYWHFVLMLLVMWSGGVPPRVLVKKELFAGAAWLAVACLRRYPRRPGQSSRAGREPDRTGSQRCTVLAHHRGGGDAPEVGLLEVRLLPDRP